MVVQDRLGAGAALVDGAAHAVGGAVVGVAALQDGPELFPVQLIERVAAHGGESGVDPLHEAVRAGHHEAFLAGLLRVRVEPREQAPAQAGRGAGGAGGKRRGERGRGDFLQRDDERAEFGVEFQDEVKLLPLRCRVSSDRVKSGLFLKRFVEHGSDGKRRWQREVRGPYAGWNYSDASIRNVLFWGAG